MKRWDVRQGKAPLTHPTALFRGCDGASILELMPGRSFHLCMDAACRLLTGWPLMKQTAVIEFKPWREAHRYLQEGAWSLHSDGQMLCRQGKRDKTTSDEIICLKTGPTASRPTGKATSWWLGFHSKELFFQNLSRTYGMTLFKLFIHSCFRGQWTKQKHLYKSVIGINCQRNVTKHDLFCA